MVQNAELGLLEVIVVSPNRFTFHVSVCMCQHAPCVHALSVFRCFLKDGYSFCHLLDEIMCSGNHFLIFTEVV